VPSLRTGPGPAAAAGASGPGPRPPPGWREAGPSRLRRPGLVNQSLTSVFDHRLTAGCGGPADQPAGERGEPTRGELMSEIGSVGEWGELIGE
jgi:hypothetical protein